jgi:hypothetical protein
MARIGHAYFHDSYSNQEIFSQFPKIVASLPPKTLTTIKSCNPEREQRITFAPEESVYYVNYHIVARVILYHSLVWQLVNG